MARLVAQPQASARTHSVATNIVNFVYGFKAQSVTKVSAQSQPVIRPNNTRRVLNQPCSVRNCSLARHRVQILGLRLWTRLTFFIPEWCSVCGQE